MADHDPVKDGIEKWHNLPPAVQESLKESIRVPRDEIKLSVNAIEVAEQREGRSLKLEPEPTKQDYIDFHDRFGCPKCFTLREGFKSRDCEGLKWLAK